MPFFRLLIRRVLALFAGRSQIPRALERAWIPAYHEWFWFRIGNASTTPTKLSRWVSSPAEWVAELHLAACGWNWRTDVRAGENQRDREQRGHRCQRDDRNQGPDETAISNDGEDDRRHGELRGWVVERPEESERGSGVRDAPQQLVCLVSDQSQEH